MCSDTKTGTYVQRNMFAKFKMADKNLLRWRSYSLLTCLWILLSFSFWYFAANHSPSSTLCSMYTWPNPPPPRRLETSEHADTTWYSHHTWHLQYQIGSTPLWKGVAGAGPPYCAHTLLALFLCEMSFLYPVQRLHCDTQTLYLISQRLLWYHRALFTHQHIQTSSLGTMITISWAR